MEKKRKARDHSKQRPKEKTRTKSLSLEKDNRNKFAHGKKRKTGPRLPSSLRKELDRINPSHEFNSMQEEEKDDDIKSIDGTNDDLYEYEEAVAEEESTKNRRYDHVENYEYELPKEFEDEDVESDDDDDEEEEEEEQHLRMLQGITGMHSEVFKGKKNKDVLISEPYPESEYNPTHDVLDGDGRITINDLLGDLTGTKGYSEVRKNVHQMERKSMPLQVPLTKDVHDKLDRKAAYEESKKLITKWEPLIKRNREAPTIIFDKDTDLGFSTIGAIASEFKPRTDMEKKIASLVYDDKLMGAHKEDGAKLLELNKIPIEDYAKYRNHVAKMRSLLFRHEVKMKRIKKIKSRTYHRLLKKDRLKSATAEILTDKEAVEMRQEFKRAEERMTLRHKNSTRWAKRIIERGSKIQDEGTRAALAEQLNQHALLTRKMKSMKDGSSSDESDDEEDDESMVGSDQDMQTKLLEKAKEKTLKLTEDDEEPKSGLFSLPFMVRADKKRKEAALEEAKLALQDFESSLKQEDTDGVENTKLGMASGRRKFGASKQQLVEPNNSIKLLNNSSDSEDEAFPDKDTHGPLVRANDLQEDVKIKTTLHDKGSEAPQDSLLKTSNIAGKTVPNTTYEVAMLVSNTWRKMGSQNQVHNNVKTSPEVAGRVTQNPDLEVVDEGSDTDSDGHMVDGMLSSGNKPSYAPPSQAELIREAFAGDDVEAEFSKDKQDIMNQENPEPEKPALLPGWGQWTHVQKKKGLPSWMLEEHEIAKRKREEAVKRRKDAHLKHVIISEKLDKKAENLLLKTLPRSFTSNEILEQSTRMPIGPEFNPETAVRVLNRPEVVKRPGNTINPIKYEDVDTYEKPEDHKRAGPRQKQKQKQKQKKNRSESEIRAVVAKC